MTELENKKGTEEYVRVMQEIQFNMNRLRNAYQLPPDVLNRYANAYISLNKDTQDKVFEIMLPAVIDGVTCAQERAEDVERALQTKLLDDKDYHDQVVSNIVDSIMQGNSNRLWNQILQIRKDCEAIAFQFGDGAVDQSKENAWTSLLTGGEGL